MIIQHQHDSLTYIDSHYHKFINF